MGLCKISEGGLAVLLSTFAPEACIAGGNTTSLGCGVRGCRRVVKHPSYLGIHLGVLAMFCCRRNRSCARRLFVVHTKKSEPGTETVAISLIIPCIQAVREVKPIQEDVALCIFKNNIFWK